jgi:hypothetical protein
VDWVLVSLLTLATIFYIWLFVPGLSFLGTTLQLNKVPHPRLLIGLGLLDVIFVSVLIKEWVKLRFSPKLQVFLAVYSAVILVLCAFLTVKTHYSFPTFLGLKRAIALSLPIPLIVCLIIFKRYTTAIALLLVFSFLSTYRVNPLYTGLGIVTKNPVISEIKNSSETARWATETSMLENFPFVAGKPSVTGVYFYPQLDLWKRIDSGKSEFIYNRYAHTNITLDRDTARNIPTAFDFPIADHFGVRTEPCGQFIQNDGITKILTDGKLGDNCAKLDEEVKLPAHTFYIYSIH